MLYLPAYTVWGLQAIIGNSYVTALPMSEFLANFPSIVPTLWSDWTRDIPLILSVFLGICFLIGVFASKHLGKVPAYLIAPLTIVIYSAMLFLQRVIPFTRVWLFLVPLWAILTAIGITVILDLFARQRMGQALAEGCALILCLGIGLNVIAAQSVYYSDATGTLRDGDQIVGFLADYLQKTDRIYATVPSDAPLLYYLKRHQLPISIIAKTADTLSTADRIIIVVNKTSMPLEEMMNRLNNLGVSTTAYTSPEFVRSFPFADLYVIRKWSAFIDTVSLKNTERF